MNKNGIALFCPADGRRNIVPQTILGPSYMTWQGWAWYRAPFDSHEEPTLEYMRGNKRFEKIDFLRKPAMVVLCNDTFTGRGIHDNQPCGFNYRNGFPISYMPEAWDRTYKGYDFNFRRSHQDHYNFVYADGHADSRSVVSLLTTNGFHMLCYERNKDFPKM